jgi:flagellar biosynthesis/type III secretory pathway chaperone
MQALQQHQDLCNELHQLALEENSFLQQHRRTPDAALLEKKKSLLARLDETLAALRAQPRASAGSAPFRTALDKTRARILQILQLDRENEQLLLRFSLARHTGGAAPAAASPAPSILQKIYQRHA